MGLQTKNLKFILYSDKRNLIYSYLFDFSEYILHSTLAYHLTISEIWQICRILKWKDKRMYLNMFSNKLFHYRVLFRMCLRGRGAPGFVPKAKPKVWIVLSSLMNLKKLQNLILKKQHKSNNGRRNYVFLKNQIHYRYNMCPLYLHNLQQILKLCQWIEIV